MIKRCERIAARTCQKNFGTLAEKQPSIESFSLLKASTTRNSGGLLYAPGGHGFGGFPFVSVGRAARRCAGRHKRSVCFVVNHRRKLFTFTGMRIDSKGCAHVANTAQRDSARCGHEAMTNPMLPEGVGEGCLPERGSPIITDGSLTTTREPTRMDPIHSAVASQSVIPLPPGKAPTAGGVPYTAPVRSD